MSELSDKQVRELLDALIRESIKRRLVKRVELIHYASMELPADSPENPGDWDYRDGPLGDDSTAAFEGHRPG